MKQYSPYRSWSLASLFTLIVIASLSVMAQSVQHLSRPFVGGMPGVPVVTGIERVTNKTTVTWDGPSGYYQLFIRTNFSATWTAWGGRTNAIRRATVTTIYSNAFFKVSGPAPKYAGAAACAGCHTSIHTSEKATAHASAYSSAAFAASGGQTNASCLPCHTVGYGLPSGFTNIVKTPNLAGVQCESCHGPGAVHAANPDDPIYRPRVEIAATLCGGCHDSSHAPIYDEWASSPHSVVVEDMNPTNRITACGQCHSGTVRMALIKGTKVPVGDANMGIGCANCHDPHRVTGNPAQLRNPITSTNDYSLATTDTFSQKYDPTVSICGQCHNDRGASWQTTSRPPHHSPQYNMMLGLVGEVPGGLPPRSSFSHADLIEGQCIGCHKQAKAASGGMLANTGHSFAMSSYDVCLQCHPYPELLKNLVQGEISSEVQALKNALDNWALTKSDPALRTRYGARAWEYTTPGSLSTGGSGPSTADQALIPDNIKKARFDIYLVVNDGTLGVHNPSHIARLLGAAEDWIKEEMNK